jgi:hypothetical protein
MVTIKKISKTELPKLIEMSYEDDFELFDKYHVIQTDFFGAVVSQLQMIHEMAEEFDLNYYKVIFQKKPIGYFVTFDKFLYSFCINKRYRTKDNLIGWFKGVKKALGAEFQTMLYKNNTRAIDHLVKQGMKIVDENEENNTVILIYN